MIQTRSIRTDQTQTAPVTPLWVPNNQSELFIHLKIEFRVGQAEIVSIGQPYDLDIKSPNFIQIDHL